MTTITLWLLLSSGYNNGEVRVVERFATVGECEHVLKAMQFTRGGLRCVQATVVKP